MYRVVVVLLVFTVISLQTFAQEQVSVSEVNLQNQFIAAHQKKVLGKLDEAIELFNNIRKEHQDLAAVAYELTILYEAKEDYTQAIKMGKEAIRLEPDNPWYRRALAKIYEKEGRFEEAAAIYQDLVKNSPNTVEYYMMQAFYLIKAQNIKSAIKVYDDLESQRGINEELSSRKYNLYLGIGDTKKAEQEIQKLLKTDPKNIHHLLTLAELYEQQGRKSDAKTQYKKVLRLDPNNGQAQAAVVEEMDGPGVNAIKYASSLLPLMERQSLNIDLKIGKLLPLIQQVVETNDKHLASALLKLADALEKSHPNNAKAFSISGDLLFYSGQPEEAIEKYQNTLELDDTVFPVWEQLMYAHLQLKQFDEVLRIAEETIDLFPNKVKAYELYGLAATKLGKTDDAIDLLNEALFMTGQNKDLESQVLHGLAKAHWRAGSLPQAENNFEKAVAAFPESPQLLNNYSRFLAEQKALDKAAATLKQAEKFAPNSWQILATFAYLSYKKKEYRKAQKDYEEALARGGENDSFVLEGLGDVFFQLEDPDTALEYWKKAFEMGEGSTVLKKKIEERRVIE